MFYAKLRMRWSAKRQSNDGKKHHTRRLRNAFHHDARQCSFVLAQLSRAAEQTIRQADDTTQPPAADN